MKQEKVENNQEIILNISIKRLFYENKTLLENFEYKVKKNDKIVIIGNTGCGKTSLLHTFNLLNPNYEGEIYYKNKNIKEYQPNYLRGEIIEVMQEPFLGNNNVKNSIIFPLNFKIHKEKKIDFEKINLYLEKFLLHKNILEKKVEEISGGEKQRIALIRALILKPRVILLDEPSSALDKNTSQIIANFFVKEWNGVVITISHSHIWEEIFPIKFYFENKKIKIK